ncbi:MAG: TraB/GumN family protein [Candidatus Berkiella sp.]
MLSLYNLKDDLRPAPSAAPSPTIQYPLVFEVIRDNQCHTVVGTFRDAPLAAFPSELQAHFKEHQLLMVDTLTKLPRSRLDEAGLTFDQTNYLITRLKGSKEAFLAQMRSILNDLDLDCPIEKIQPLALITLWDVLKGTKMERDFVSMAKAQGMQVVMLKPLTKWLSDMREQIDSPYYSEDSLCFSFSQVIDEYYQNGCALNPMVLQQLQAYLTENIETNRLPSFMVEELTPLNQAMFTHFMEKHQEGQDKILMACGFEHLFGGNGLLAKLDAMGFQVRQCKSTHAPTPF